MGVVVGVVLPEDAEDGLDFGAAEVVEYVCSYKTDILELTAEVLKHSVVLLIYLQVHIQHLHRIFLCFLCLKQEIVLILKFTWSRGMLIDVIQVLEHYVEERNELQADVLVEDF